MLFPVKIKVLKRRNFLKSTGLITTMGFVSQKAPFLLHDNNEATVSGNDNQVTLENTFTSLVFDLTRGIYHITDKVSGSVSLSDAALKINEWRSDDAGYKRSWKKRIINDTLGKGTALDIVFEKENSPRLLFSFILYPAGGFVKITGSIDNILHQPIQVKEIYVVANAKLFPGEQRFDKFAMIDGFSAGEPLEYGERMYSPLTRANALKSRNNILLTYAKNAKQKVAVMGGLTYYDFQKFASIEQTRRIELEKGLDGEKSLLCYLNLPFDIADQKNQSEKLTLAKGSSLQKWHYHEFRCEETASAVKSPEEILITAEKLVPGKKYAIGFSWWNGYQYGNHEDNFQSVFVEYNKSGQLNRLPLVTNRAVPRFDGKKKMDVEQAEFLLPAEAAAAGSFTIRITKGNGPEKDRNVYLGEIWLRDGSFKPLYPDQLTPVKECITPRISYTANLYAMDPVGKRVDPGSRYESPDSFYIDLSAKDPFTALEEYGKRVSRAQDIALSMYDFPTVCLWYAENVEYGNSGAENSTQGAVNEMQHIKDSGFLNYSRAAVRLVPDSYMPDNQQGWFDDAHWQAEVKPHVGGKHGRYVVPYETSEKWGKAVTALGGIPITYFQTSYRSEDYAKAFPEHMLFNKTYAWRNEPVDTNSDMFTSWEKTWVRNGRVVWGYDYTDPGFTAHMTEVYRNLKKGGIKGLMFDYPYSGWASAGGMEDKYSTAAAAYRNIFKLANDGLGPEAYVHERNMEQGSDMTIGLIASMRTENDTDLMDSVTVTRCGLRWYKNRVLLNQDPDSKNLLPLQHNRDLVRAVLTMCYVVTGRLLLANSFSRFTKETLWDIERTFPYHTANKSARPADAFVSPIPMVYDYDINERWHQVTFFNPDQKKSKKIGIHISGERVNGSLALDPAKVYYVYDFWNDHFIGKVKGGERLEQELRPGEARMMSVREALPYPQVLSTDRHIMQGYLDIKAVHWEPGTKTLKGTSKVIGGDPYIIVVATNGYKGMQCSGNHTDVKVTVQKESEGLLYLKLESSDNRELDWTIAFKRNFT